MSDNIILGIDPGVGSIGLFKRDIDKSDKLSEQLIGGSILTFPAGFTQKDNMKSLATERGDKRRGRNHIQSRKQCKWATLELLINLGMCPLSMEELDKWRKYDKNADIKHPYPTSQLFRAWLKCDFNNDGKPDFSMFELRNNLAIDKGIDLSTTIGKLMLGRVVYHMAIHRGFRSSKGDRATENQENRGIDEHEDLKGAEEGKAKEIKNIMQSYNLPTIGCALYYLNNIQKERIRASKYTIIAKQNKQELEYIFNLHEELGDNRLNMCKRIIKVVFKVKPLGSQKGNIGYCVFENNKQRAPKSRPEFEIYRAWSFINNIRDITNNKELSLDVKRKLFEQNFWKSETFKFGRISNFIKKELSNPQIKFNYEDNFEVSGCPILFLLKENSFLGEDWDTTSISIDKKRVSRKQKNKHQIVHTWETIWNKCYTGDKEDIIDFCTNKIKRKDWEQPMLKLMNLILKADGYTHLSTYAIKKINKFLCQGFILDKAILLAKIPDIIGNDVWHNNKNLIKKEISSIYTQVEKKRLVVKITNNLIASYKQLCLDDETAFAVHDYDYILDNSDKQDVYSAVAQCLNIEDERFSEIRNQVEERYQLFFKDKKRAYIKPTSLRDELIEFLNNNFDCDTTKLYNHSLIEKYTYKPLEIINQQGVRVQLLGNPQLHNLKNPVVLRTMYKLRNILNYMLESGQISNDSRLVIETAKEFNDTNMRWAIKRYEDIREYEKVQLEKIVNNILKEYNKIATNNDIKIARYAYEQSLLCNGDYNYDVLTKKDSDRKKEIIERYKLWKEQNFKCIYTGRIISLTEVLNGDTVDIEHTLPLSKSMDNSDENKTLCDATFNRFTKKNMLPSQLGDKIRNEIDQNIEPWRKRVKFLYDKIQYWKSRSRKAASKEDKDFAIRNMHLYRMEYEHWENKVSRFTIEKIEPGFVHRQLSDTRTITRYLVEYLRVVFPNISVQNSNITSAFREIIGIKEKNRENNLHHAQDAAILSLIPPSYMRDRIMQVYYEIKETKKLIKTEPNLNHRLEKLNRKLLKLKRLAHLDTDINNILDVKVNDIIVNNLSTNRVLNITRRKYRKNGKVVSLRNENNNVVRDQNGNIIPYRWHQGRCIRGKLCQETFYGAIKSPIVGKDKKIQKDAQGNIQYEIKYVKRESVNTLSDLKKLIDGNKLVDKKLQSYLQKQIANKNIRVDSDNCIIVNNNGLKIRHLRCYTGNGVIPIKEHKDYASKYKYKNLTYCENGTNAYYAIYENNKGKRKCEVLNLYTISKIEMIDKTKDNLFPLYMDKKNDYIRKYVLEPGTRVIMQEDTNDCIRSLDRDDMIKRLYIINNFRDKKDGRVFLKHHTISKTLSNKECLSQYNTNDHIAFIVLSRENLNFWVEGYDFDILPDGEIKIR